MIDQQKFFVAAEMALASPLNIDKCVIYADNQPAIKATMKPDKQSGQAILNDTIDKLEKLVITRNIAAEIV